jgi:CheY-like chemotaxis protein
VRVLIVDDDPIVAAGLARMVPDGYEASLSDSALAALERCAAEPIAVIVSDYRMPEHDGLWLMEQLRSRHPQIHRMLCSGCPPADLHAHLIGGLVQSFLHKPVHPQVFRESLAAAATSAPSRVETR